MIYTVTLNPTLDITYVLEDISFDEPVTAQRVLNTPGGKGINVSRVLRAMGTDSVAVGLIGGHVGEEVLDLLHEEGLILQIMRIKNETRTNIIVLGQRDRRQLVIRASGPTVEATDTEKVTRLIFQIAQAPEVMVLSGSLPPGMSDDIYFSLAQEGKNRGTKVVLDAEGEPLRVGIEAGPYLIKPNVRELGELAGRELAGEEEIAEYCRGLLKKGIEVVAVSMGKDGALMVTGSGVWKGNVPPVTDDTVGAGDSMVAGMVMGMVQGQTLERMFRTGLACGVSAVINEGPGLAEPETFTKAFPQVTVEKIA